MGCVSVKVKTQQQQTFPTSSDLIVQKSERKKDENNAGNNDIEVILSQKNNQMPNQNSTPKNLLNLKNLEIRLEKFEKDIQYQYFVRIRHDLFDGIGDVIFAIEVQKTKFKKLKEQNLNELKILKKNAQSLKKKQQINLPNLEFIKQIEYLEKDAYIIRKNFMEIAKQKIYHSVTNFKIFTLQNFGFFKKKIKSISLLYKASQNNFQVNKFWQLCDGKSHTITIIKTEFGKIIGGYTPLSWKKKLSTKRGTYQKDESKETFIFSITQNHKLTLINGEEEKAIQHDCNHGPIFAREIIICNQIRKSIINVGSSYNNGIYIKDDQKSIKRFSGQENGCQVRLDDWQVHQIQFL